MQKKNKTFDSKKSNKDNTLKKVLISSYISFARFRLCFTAIKCQFFVYITAAIKLKAM